MKGFKVVISFVSIILLFFSYFSCKGKLTESDTAILIIYVVDNDSVETPISNVEIIVTPGNITKKTDSKGLCRFELDPGNYYVDAKVCCIGPGWIQYHEPVNVIINESKILKLHGCLACL
jgi:hypothetical protein